MLDTLIASVGDALRRRVPMALFAMPGAPEPYTFFEAEPHVLADENRDFGFFYAPFVNDGRLPMLLQPAADGKSTAVDTVGEVGLPPSTSREAQREHVATIVAHHAASGGGKTVYARRISDPYVCADWCAVASRYFDAFPDTFRFLFTTPDAGCWLGATPELLLRRDAGSDIITTMALAGTLRDSRSAWDAKNIEEHDYVTRFIVDTFARFGIRAEVSPAEDVHFGAIRHLCHRITARYSGPLIPLLNALSPTPALSGFPREASFDMIRTLETPRSLYGGYVGVNSAEGIRVFVNLRSMCFNPSGGCCIYAGGGITAMSDPADEWLETEAKSSVLRRCVAECTLQKSVVSTL